jgi:FkbM family methyltransferase
MTAVVYAEQHWTTPRGRAVRMQYREGTNDWNTINAVMEDEYALAELPALSGLALDVGAHVGAVSVALAADNPNLHVVAVEPLSVNCAMIEHQRQVNGLADRLSVVCGAVDGASSPAHVEIRYDYEGNIPVFHHRFVGNTPFDKTHPADRWSVERAKRWTLAALLAQFGSVDFLKIDCEGAEFGFFEAPEDNARVRLIYGEWHSVDTRVEANYAVRTQAELEQLLTSTHTLEFPGPQSGHGHFIARLR